MDVAGMQNARLGAIYLWQGTKHKSPLAETVLGGMLSSAGALAGIKDINIPVPDQAVDLVSMGIQSGRDTGPQGGLWATIKAWAEDFVQKVWEKIKETLGDVAEIGGHIKKIALFVTQQVFQKAAPLIGGAVGLVQGLWKTTVAFVEKLGNWIAKKSVSLNFGHPKTLVKGIEHGITRALLEGLYETARSALSIGLNAASLGGAVIVDAVAAVIEAATKIIWRFAESRIISKFCEQATHFWTARAEKSALHLDAMKFDNWLKPATRKVPVIAAVTLGSGIAGDKMRFLQMYTGGGDVISANQFKSGVKYLDQMKRAGSRLIERTGIDFTSNDQMIDGLLKLAKSHDEVKAATNFWHKLFRTGDKIVRA